MRSFLICVHDATPAYAREIRVITEDLAPLIGRRLSFGVVPDWQGEWPLAAHQRFCRFLQDSSEERLLHGYFHRRRAGWGPVSLLTDGSDEMNGLDFDATQRTLDRGQRVLTEVFGEPARGFLAPAWQRGHIRRLNDPAAGFEHAFGFFSLDGCDGRSIPLATATWDCGRWSWLGYVGHGVGTLLRSLDRVPVLAIHPSDLDRGFWPKIIRLTRELLDAGLEPMTPTSLLQARDVHAA